jgi:hypothetical protein
MSVSWHHYVLVRSDETAIKVDRNFSYAVFVSYAEVYNEKVSQVPLASNALMIDI